MTQPNQASSNQTINGHPEKSSNGDGQNLSAREETGEFSGGDEGRLLLSPDNPFYAIASELQFLSSGVGLSLRQDGDVDTLGTEGLDVVNGTGGRVGGREWMNVVQKMKGFVGSSDENIYQISPDDPSACPPVRSPRPMKRDHHASSTRVQHKRPKTSCETDSNPQTEVDGRTHAGPARKVDVYPAVPIELVKMVYRSSISKASSTSPESKSVNRLNGASSHRLDIDLADTGLQKRNLASEEKNRPIWSKREDLVCGLMALSESGILLSDTAQAPPSTGTALDGDGGGTAPAANTSKGLADASGAELEVKLEDYWPARRIPRASDRRVARPVVAESTLPTVNERAHTEIEKKKDEDEDEEEDPEFTLGFRLPGCMRGWVVFGPRVPRSRKSWPALPGRDAEKESGRKRLLAVRFNVFADTELNKGKNDLSAYKTMVDLGRYLGGLELSFEETLVRLGAFKDLLNRACFVCHQVHLSPTSTTSRPAHHRAGPGAGGTTTTGGLPIGRARASSGEESGWRAYHLECL